MTGLTSVERQSSGVHLSQELLQQDSRHHKAPGHLSSLDFAAIILSLTMVARCNPPLVTGRSLAYLSHPFADPWPLDFSSQRLHA